ncbi:MAG: LamG-like jellyroll fold domain-containing protein [Bacteroidota bacterium]|nr:LamG-like jellyroll fold domain-containing protein [Bacteroidota bacterium]
MNKIIRKIFAFTIFLQFIFMACNINSLYAQTVERIVISSCGKSVSNGYNRVSFTIGEPAVNNLGNPNNILTQGFQQGEICNVDLTNGLVAYYPFNGNAKDMSGNNNNATVYGASLTTDRFGNQNSAYSFNGTDNYLKILQSPSLTNLTNATFSYWVKYTLPDGKVASTISNGPDGNSYNEDGFFTWALNKSIMHNLGRQGNFQSASIGYNATKSTNYQNFVFVTVVIDADYIKTYRNGILEQTTPRNSKSISRPHLDWFIGQSGANTYYLNGVMDDIRIYNRAINECEISALYNLNRCEVTISNSHGTTPCSGMPTLLTGGGCKNYSWSTGETTPNISVTPTVPTTYSVTGTNGGCTATASLEVMPATVDVNSGLALHIPLDNNSADISGNNNSVTVYGGTALTSDRFGNASNAMSFDGTTGYIRIAQSPSLNNLQNATISYWVKYNTPTGKVGVTISNGQDDVSEEGFYSYALSNKLMYFLGKHKDPNNVYASISYDATQPLVSQQFSLVTVVIDENTISTYLNGKLQESNPRNGMPISRPGQDWYIGQSGAKTQFLSGAVDDIRIYNRALNQCEISTLYNTNNCGVPINAMTKTVCKGYPATITIDGNANATYKWSTGGTGTTQTVSPTVSTKYYITVTQPSGCKSIDSYWVYVVNCNEDASNSDELGVNSNELKNGSSVTALQSEFNVYPNPVYESAKIEYTIVNSGKVEICVYNIIGSKIAVLTDEIKAGGSYSAEWSREGLKPGVYFMEMKTGNERKLKKVVIM